MKYHYKIFKAFIKNCYIRDMEYRQSFLATLLSTSFWVFMQIFFFRIIFSNIKEIGDWNFAEMTLLLGIFLFLDTIIFMLFIKNFANFNKYVNSGELDPVLTKPVNTQFFISFRYFATTMVLHLPLGLFIITYSLFKMDIEPSIWTLVLFSISLISSLIIAYSFWFMTMCAVFFFDKLEDAQELFGTLWQFAKIPDVYRGNVKFAILFLLPMVFSAYIPAGILLGKIGSVWVLYYLIMAVLTLYLSTKVWKQAVKRYTSAG